MSARLPSLTANWTVCIVQQHAHWAGHSLNRASVVVGSWHGTLKHACEWQAARNRRHPMLECSFRRWSARLGGPRLWGNSTRSNRIGCPHIGQTSTCAVTRALMAGAGRWRSAVRRSRSNATADACKEAALAYPKQSLLAHLDEALGQDVLEEAPP